MYTECPSCNTLFKVTTAQLKTAAGKVRCGRCNTVFNALERLTDDLPEGATGLTEAATEAVTDDAVAQASASAFDEVAIPGMDTDEFGSGEADEGPEFDLGAGLDDLIEPVASETPSDDGGGIPDFDLDEPAPAPAPAAKAEDSFFDLPDEPAVPQADLAATDLEPPGDSFFAGLDEDMRMPAAGDDTRLETAHDRDRKKEAEGAGSDFLDDPLDAVHKEFSAIDDSNSEADAYVLEELNSGSGRSPVSFIKNLVWVLVIVTLLVVLVAQFAYFKRAELAQNPTFKPYLEKMCEIIGPYVSCDVPDPIDLDSISILDKNVVSHPKSKNALLITATVENKAEFDQPYPVLILSFSDINQKIIARREFRPSEYLDNKIDPASLMAVGVPVRLMLEIVDPGVDAVNFEFTFKPRPESD